MRRIQRPFVLPLICLAFVCLAFAVPVDGEIYSAPRNIQDISKGKLAGRQAFSDRTLAYYYLEPHRCCSGLSDALNSTITAVNRYTFEHTIDVDWNSVVRSLVLQPLGPGQVKIKHAKRDYGSVTLRGYESAALTIDLQDHFEVSGASVYQLRFVCPLNDGRVHVSDATQFTLEDRDELSEYVAARLTDEELRQTAVRMLSANPVFCIYQAPKTYGHEKTLWRGQPHMLKPAWGDSIKDSRQVWQVSMDQLRTSGHKRFESVLDCVLDRLIHLSHNLSCELHHGMIERMWGKGFQVSQTDAAHARLALCRNRRLARMSLSVLSGRETAVARSVLMRVAAGPESELAALAMSALSSHDATPEIERLLRQQMAHADAQRALQAAIVSIYSGDGSGLPIILKCINHQDTQIRKKAIGQVVDLQFKPHANRIAPLLLSRLALEKDITVLVRLIETLRAYPSQQVLEAVEPFTSHTDARVRARATFELRRIKRELP